MSTIERLGAAPSPHKSLAGEDAEAWVATLGAVVRAARLNQYYPDPRRVAAHLGALSSRVHGGLYASLEIHGQSGLPSYREWVRVQSDAAIAQEQLAQLGAREALAARAAQAPGVGIHHKQLAKCDYYQHLAGLDLAPLGDVQIQLRRVEPERRRAHFHVVFDKLDASGFLVRYSIDMAQEHSLWSRPKVTMDAEATSCTQAFQALIYRFGSYDAEFTYARLASEPGLSVERVHKGTLGPIYTSLGPFPEALAPILGGGGPQMTVVAGVALDSAAPEVTQTRNNDPWSAWLEAPASVEVRHVSAQARESYGYRVFKDRKFVVSRHGEPALRAFCHDMGTRNVIHSI